MAQEIKEVNQEDREIDPVEVDPELLEETETPTESSPENKPNQEEEKTEEVKSEPEESDEEIIEPEEPKPKEVPGETPREKALRLEVERLKKERREARGKSLIKDSPVSSQKEELTEEERAALNKYDPEELKNLEEVLRINAKKLGFVKKDELQKTTYEDSARNVLDSFLENHPEYLPENDKDDVLWNRFQKEYALYKVPSNPIDLKKIFNKIHREIFEIKPSSELGKIRAGEEKLKSASHAGTQRGTHTTRTQPIDNSLRGLLKGFDDDELDEILSN